MEAGQWFGSIFTQHSVVNSCPEDESLPVGETDKCLASASAWTSVSKRAYSTAAIFNVSSLNVSAVTSVISFLWLSCTHSHLAPYRYMYTHGMRENVSRDKQTHHYVATVLMSWWRTNGLILGQYHLKQRTSCCHQNLFSNMKYKYSLIYI